MRNKFRTAFRLLSKRGGDSNQLMPDFNYPKYHIFRTAFGDQKGQVGYLLNYIFNYQERGLKRNGYFVDLAAADGILHSNTYFLEKHLEWTGLLIEANETYLDTLRHNRTSTVVSACVSDKPGASIQFRVDNGFLGGIVSEETDNNNSVRGKELAKADVITMEGTTLEQILIDHNAPQLIDFLSLDVEGAEYLVLRNFDFEKFKFHALAIERPCANLDALLDEKGYVQLAHLHEDVLYCHRDYLGAVNFRPSLLFSLTSRKDW